MWTIVREWGRIGCLGFGGPPAHISLLRRLCVTDRGWLSDAEFEDGIAATNLLPGPASTQLAIFCAWRLRGARGALVGGLCFIVPGLIVILALAAVFLGNPPRWVQGAAAGAGSAVAMVAVHAAVGLFPGSWRRAAAPTGATAGPGRGRGRGRARWVGYAVAGAAAGVFAGQYLVLVLLTCGLVEVVARGRWRPRSDAVPSLALLPFLPALPAARPSGWLTVAWVALKVGLLSYGGGFVIIPLMQSDAVSHYHWLTAAQFLNAVALGQITPGPVVQTVAVVGYAAAGLGGGLFAALVAFAPSFAFVLLGAPRFAQLRANTSVQAFLTGAGPAVIGAIAGSAVPLARALTQPWQYAVLAAAAVWLLVLRRGVVPAILVAGVIGAVGASLGLPVSP
ncbi:MAG: chromate transporter [Frankiaceae bacterium]|nr:chromate transporter [Frankiaceae bacterium]